MRSALALCAALALATAATAQPRLEDRYGPSRAPRPEAAAPAPSAAPRYAGPMLTWAGKTVVAAPAAQPVAEPARAERPVQVASAPPRPAPPPPAQPHAPLPASLYEAPSPAPAPTRRAAAPPAPRPQPAAPEPALQRGSGQAPNRYYSLHREYGLAPDAIPAVPARPGYVLIGPPDGAATDDKNQAKASDLDPQF